MGFLGLPPALQHSACAASKPFTTVWCASKSVPVGHAAESETYQHTPFPEAQLPVTQKLTINMTYCLCLILLLLALGKFLYLQQKLTGQGDEECSAQKAATRTAVCKADLH